MADCEEMSNVSGVGDRLDDRFVDVDGVGLDEGLRLYGDRDVEDGDCDGGCFGDGFETFSSKDVGGKRGSKDG